MDRMDMNDAMDEVFNARNAVRQLDDTDRNILAGLAHEACEAHCDDCGTCLGPYAGHPKGGNPMADPEGVEFVERGDETFCLDCDPTVPGCYPTPTKGRDLKTGMTLTKTGEIITDIDKSIRAPGELIVAATRNGRTTAFNVHPDTEVLVNVWRTG